MIFICNPVCVCLRGRWNYCWSSGYEGITFNWSSKPYYRKNIRIKENLLISFLYNSVDVESTKYWVLPVDSSIPKYWYNWKWWVAILNKIWLWHKEPKITTLPQQSGIDTETKNVFQIFEYLHGCEKYHVLACFSYNCVYTNCTPALHCVVWRLRGVAEFLDHINILLTLILGGFNKSGNIN